MTSVHHLTVIAAQLQAVAIGHRVWVGDINALTDIVADKLPGIARHAIARCAHSNELQQELLNRDVAIWRGANYKFRLIDQQVPDSPDAALKFVRTRVDGGTTVCRFCGLRDDPHEIQYGGQLIGLHLMCRRAWYRVNRIAMHATRGAASAKSWWQTLELDRPNATSAEIEQAYRRLAQKHHPDKGGDPEVMRAINEARDQATDKRFTAKTKAS